MIIKSAIIHEGHVITGKRHHNCIAIAAQMVKQLGIGKLPINGEQGFITNDFRFLDRREAAKHALAVGQISKLKYNSKELFSEDLW